MAYGARFKTLYPKPYPLDPVINLRKKLKATAKKVKSSL